MRKLIKWHIDDDSVESSVKHDNSWKINQITSVKRYHSKLFLLSNIGNKKAIESKKQKFNLHYNYRCYRNIRD